MSEKITLSGVPETMLQTVYARAKETKTRGAITDNKAVELIDRLDYDFSMADKDAAMHSGVIARTIVLDKLVKTYLAGHGGAVVVLYLCGVAGFLRVGAVAVLLALAAVWVVGLVQYRPAGVAAAWKRAASAPGFTLFLGGAASVSYTHLTLPTIA